MSRIHVIGAGLAGLSAAITASGAGRPVTVYESTAAAGGRCRSYHDAELDIRLDNGNHLMLSGNTSTFAYIAAIGAADRVTGPRRAIFPFLDLKSGRDWTLRPSRGRIPWWLLFPERRVPRTSFGEHLMLRSIGRDWDDTVIAETIPHDSLYWLMLEPLSVAALNTRPHEALACLFGAVMRETLLKGGKACLPRLPKAGLSDALIDPAIATLRHRGAEVKFSQRVTGLIIEEGRVTGLVTADGDIPFGPDESVVLAVPPWAARELLPDLTVPDAFESILNLHYKVAVEPIGDMVDAGFLGLINSVAEWVFVKPDHVSVTISAANKIIDQPAADLAVTVWREVVRALELPKARATDIPPFRVIKERRATIKANAEQEEKRPETRTPLANLMLAGDWTDTRLPATIEGAIRSGVLAAQAIVAPRAAPKAPRRAKKLVRENG